MPGREDAAARAFVEVVDVLRDDPQVRPLRVGPVGECAMADVGLDIANELGPPAIPGPDEVGVALPRVDRRELLRVVALPQARLRVAERGDAALDAHPRAREDDDVTRIARQVEDVVEGFRSWRGHASA